MPMRMGNNKLERRALAAARRRDERLAKISEYKNAQRASDTELNQARARQLDNTNYLEGLRQEHEARMQQNRLNAVADENALNRYFQGNENELTRRHNYGMDINRLDSAEGIASEKYQRDLTGQGYERDLDRFRATPKTIKDPVTGLDIPNPDYQSARDNYLRHFNQRSLGNDVAMELLGKNPNQNQDTSAFATNNSRTSRAYDPYGMYNQQPREVSPYQYNGKNRNRTVSNNNPIEFVDGVYTNEPGAPLKNITSRDRSGTTNLEKLSDNINQIGKVTPTRQTSSQQGMSFDVETPMRLRRPQEAPTWAGDIVNRFNYAGNRSLREYNKYNK